MLKKYILPLAIITALIPCMLYAEDRPIIDSRQNTESLNATEAMPSVPFKARITPSDLVNRRTSKARQGGILVHNRNAAVFYEDRIEFFLLTPEMSTGTRGLLIDDRVINPKEITPKGIIWFQHRSMLLSKKGAKYSLLCANISLPKVGSRGLENFCGVISIEGDVIFQFPVKQHVPDTMLKPLAISDDGRYAEVWVGKIVPGEDRPAISEPREVLAWRYPNQFKRFPGPWKKGQPKEPHEAFDNLLQGFKTRMIPR